MKTKIDKSFEIDKPISLVWKSLSDPTEIVTCVPGASITEKIDQSNFKGEVVTKFGPVKVKYDGEIQIVELDEAITRKRGETSGARGSVSLPSSEPDQTSTIKKAPNSGANVETKPSINWVTSRRYSFPPEVNKYDASLGTKSRVPTSSRSHGLRWTHKNGS